MAGSYRHCVTSSGKLRNNESFIQTVENLGDLYEAVEEMYGMIWLLAAGDATKVEDARQRYDAGIALSPGIQSQ